MGKYIPPSIGLTAFSCPHCGTLTTQYWYHLSARELDKDHTPNVMTKERSDETLALLGKHRDVEKAELKSTEEFFARLMTGSPFLNGDSHYVDTHLRNVHVSRCYE